MRWCPDPLGRFPQRPFYELAELDRECEQLVESFLRRYRQQPKGVVYPMTTNELCILVEQETADLDLYADLSHRGAGVQGETVFVPNGKPIVRITEALQQPHRENRLRTTLTHELGHVRFHNYLYGLYPAGPSPCCVASTLLEAPSYDWMEWQAGYCSGSFLMPSRALRHVVRNAKRALRSTGTPEVTSVAGQAVIDYVVEAFHVSRDAARVRLLQQAFLTE